MVEAEETAEVQMTTEVSRTSISRSKARNVRSVRNKSDIVQLRLGSHSKLEYRNDLAGLRYTSSAIHVSNKFT